MTLKSIQRRKKYLRNKEKEKARRRERYMDNKERELLVNKKYHEEHKDEIKVTRANYYKKKKECALRKYLSNLKYERKNKDKRREMGRIHFRNWYCRKKAMDSARLSNI